MYQKLMPYIFAAFATIVIILWTISMVAPKVVGRTTALDTCVTAVAGAFVAWATYNAKGGKRK